MNPTRVAPRAGAGAIRAVAMETSALARCWSHREWIIPKETPMRPFQAVLVAAALLVPTAGHAQSAYDYPWCGIYTSSEGAGGGMACYFTSFAQCMATMSGL